MPLLPLPLLPYTHVYDITPHLPSLSSQSCHQSFLTIPPRLSKSSNQIPKQSSSPTTLSLPHFHIQSAPHQFRPTHSRRWYIEDVNIRKDHHQAVAVIYLHSLLFNKAIRGFIGDHCGICGGGEGTWWRGRYSNSVSHHIAASEGRAQIRVYVSIISWLPRRKWKASVRVLHSSIHW